MGNRNVGTAIDLSKLGLNEIKETEEEFQIGAMTSLRELEVHKGLAAYTNGAMKESLRHIVGVQFRNRDYRRRKYFRQSNGFSDVLTMFLAMDTEVELYKRGRISLKEFAAEKPDRDILVRLIVKKKPARMAYISQRNSSTDFPVLTCAVSIEEDGNVKWQWELALQSKTGGG